MVYLYLPLRPLRPFRPFQRSCRLAQAKQKQTHRAAQPNFLSEGVRCNARQKKYGWAVLWRTAHSYLFLLAEADDPLSQEITPLGLLSRATHLSHLHIHLWQPCYTIHGQPQHRALHP